MKPLVVFDGDVLCFRIAAACEDRSILATHIASGRTKEFKHRTALKDFIADTKFNYEDFEVVDVRVAEDISFALQTVKHSIKNTLAVCGTDEYEIYLSGSDNFRDLIPLPSKYKGSREDALRPLLLDDIRAYCKNHHSAVGVYGMEADDMLSIRAYDGVKCGRKIIQVTNDKDATQCEGWLLNPDKMETPIYIEGLGRLYRDDKGKVRGEGRKWLYFQWLAGDKVDCYKPSELSGKKFGDVAAFNLLNPCSTDEECIAAVAKQYQNWYPAPLTYTAWDGVEHTKDYIGIAQMYFDAAYMRRWKDDVVDIKSIFNNVGVWS